MMHKLLTALLTLVLLICAIPFASTAEAAPPTTLSAPEHFGVGHNSGGYVYFTFSAPENLRAYIDKRAAEDPENKRTFTTYFQVDYKIDGGSWHHTSEWDSPKTVPDKIDDLYFNFASGTSYFGKNSWDMTSLFPGDETLKAFADSGWEYFKSHSITFRARFAHSFDSGNTYVLSPWSKEYTLSANTKADCNKLINHAPSLLSAKLKDTGDGEPYFDIKLAVLPGEVADLHSISGNSVRTEVWMRRAGDKDFKYIEYEWADHELLNIEASDYFGDTQKNYAAESFEVKVRYALDLRKYKQSGYDGSSNSVDIYGPFSNVISQNMPAWSNASQWAKTELKKADDAGLIPDILKGADLTKPITREEFAELAVKLYEKTTDKAAVAAATNPFPDTKNPEVLKAYKLGVTTGISTAKGLIFAPNDLINREQCSTMLYRALKVIAPGGNYSIAGVKDFPDQKYISSWAVEGTKYMSKLGIIKGDSNGYFMPKAVTSAQEASGYGSATREAAILMGVRSYDQIKSGALGTPSGDGGTISPSGATTPSSGATSTPAQPKAPAGEKAATSSSLSSAFPKKTMPTENSIIGAWVHIQANTFGTLAGTMARHYYVFYPDGTFMYGMPDNGLYNFNIQERKDTADASATTPHYGTYTFKNGKGQLTGYNGAKLEITMESSNGGLNIGNYKGFMFIPWLDGKRLDGAFTTIVPNINGVITENAIAQEPESFLYLNKDGTFEDQKGIFRWQGKNYPTMDELFPTGEEREKLVYPAKGTYEIIDFSLILHYEDGITTKHKILLDVIEMTELDYSSQVISPKEIYIRRERARSNLKFFQ